MRIPRDINGDRLAGRLKRLGYVAVRTTGSHLILTKRFEAREHHVTIPLHKPVRVGTLRAILTSVAGSEGISINQLCADLDL